VALETLRLRAGDLSQDRRVSSRCVWLWNCGTLGGVFQLAGGGTCCRGRTSGLERIAGLAVIAFEMPQDSVDNPRIGDDGDNLHLCAADTEKRIHLENLLDEAGPGCPASLNEFRGGIGRCARACRRRGLLLARGFRRTCAVGERSVIPHAMPTAIGDVGRDGVDPVEGVEEANGRTGAGIGRCGDLKHAADLEPKRAVGHTSYCVGTPFASEHCFLLILRK